jgi:transaldolase
MTNLHKMYELGQAVWCDSISRGMLRGGEMARLISDGVVGVTSNPTIFMKAISGGKEYDDQFADVANGKSPEEIFELLALDDIRAAADMFRPVYDRTKGLDGYISYEVNPHLAFDTARTLAEAKRLFHLIGRPNIFIKIPATNEGLPAIEAALAQGININITLIFSTKVHEQVMAAYIAGLERYAAGGGDISKMASVASFFVSRVDTLVDERLQKTGKKVDHLVGKAANANAKIAYDRFMQIFHGTKGEQPVPDNLTERWRKLAVKGARVQRPLWASTSTKNPKYPDLLYVDPLIGPETVNTMPVPTIAGTIDHARVDLTLARGLDEAKKFMRDLAAAGVAMADATEQLRQDGVRLFAESFDELMANIRQKQKQLAGVA